MTRIQQSFPLCPECKQGKHANCDGEAWDNRLDQPTSCGCTADGHTGGGAA